MSTEIKVPFSRPSINEEEEKAVLEVVRSGWLTTGKVTLAFEKEFSDFMNSALKEKNVMSLAVNSNTSGMILAMHACGVKPGTAVITTPYTFVSTAACAKHLGADVIFCDIEKDSYNIDPDKIQKILEENEKSKKYNIKAIVPVHIAGTVCNMKRILELAKKYNLRVIEDAAHSFPSLTESGYAGTLGDCGVFSFYATKPLTTGEGGMVCTKDPELLRNMQMMRLHGMDRTTWDRYTSPKASWQYDIVAPGYKFNLPDILSAIGRVQLKKTEEFYQKRKHICDIYNREFSKIDFVEIPPDTEGNAWHLYLLRLKLDKVKINRDDFSKQLQENGIGVSMHFIPLFHFSYWQSLDSSFTKDNYPNAEDHFIRTITLPLWPDMSDEMAYETIEAVKKIGKENYAG
ncbi:MAG: DegT/DnrJ/EryC1/StrS aminotransferase family protein [Treponema sp.]|uniref:DegT/DnrJ/EryC1/StrS family aminotransferase n=1 Tax=Treponema sp. TaxID=166 RepID=UPI00298E25A4|nr:DegT/DnrJ/EryC1/StrS aminotransferase family protein [Treponema sp.]MCQ2600265.1 DegT/DnrJ/EryC1/StrS aminotransferase family protein [Treponema sp.]